MSQQASVERALTLSGLYLVLAHQSEGWVRATYIALALYWLTLAVFRSF